MKTKTTKKTTDEPSSDNASATSSSPYRVQSIPGMFQNWFLDYASYVILERAVPEITDGLKPVQRRILHALHELEDGRYNKVANVVGHTMQYHPHGDSSIGDALVQLGQKNLLIDCQGNWGNILTGDSAAAPRYIEARLSPFALDVVYNPKTTLWKPSYDGRHQEPIALPVKFPLLLAQGVMGIAVGLNTEVLPHNFVELLQASIDILNDEDFTIYPDFQTGGLMDVSAYQDGKRGGKVRIRSRISQLDKKTLVIEDIPYGQTTEKVIESIMEADEKGKIKILKIEDNTAENVEIVVHLKPGVSPDVTIDALYAFTDCEVSVSPNACVIKDGMPAFMDVKEILRFSTFNTVELLKQELKIRQEELENDWHYTSLEKIFFEERLYRELEKDAKKWEDLLKGIEKAFAPYAKRLRRAVTKEDIVKLTEKPVRKISKFDVKKADLHLKDLEAEMKEVSHKLKHITQTAIEYFEHILEKYGKGRERKTEIRKFEVIQAARVAASNQKLYVNREEGFVGTGMKKDEYVCECSDLDDIIVFRQDGCFMVVKAADKVFVGKDILYVSVFTRNDERTIYNMAYHDGKSGFAYVKRFAIGGVTRDKEYLLTQGTPGTKLLYFTANPNGEAEVVKVYLKPKPKLKKLQFEFDFKTLAVKGRGSMGNILSRNPVKKVMLAEEGVSTLGARRIWYDEVVKRLNAEERGLLLGEFKGDDRILTLMENGAYKLTSFDLNLHFEEDMTYIGKYYPDRIITAVYVEPKTNLWYIKRFYVEMSDKRVPFVDEDARCCAMSTDYFPRLLVTYAPDAKGKVPTPEEIDVAEFIAVKGFKAKGKRLSNKEIESVQWLDPVEEDPDYEELLQSRRDAEAEEAEGVEADFEDEDEGGTAEQLSLDF